MSDRGQGVEARLSQKTLITYSAMALGFSVFAVAINVMLPQLYAKELGIALADLGLALLFIRIFDAVSDQVVGFLSDRTRTRFGSRKPWIVAGTVVTLVSCYYLFMPPEGAGIGYFVIWRIAYDIGWTMAGVAYTAWGAELSPNYSDRSKINGYAGVSTNLGVMVKNLAPIALFWLGVTQTSAFSMDMFQHLYWICLPIIPILTAISVIFTPSGQATTRERPDFLGVIRSVRHNRPFWFYMAGFLIASLGQGITTLLFTFYDSYLKIGQWYPYIMMGFGGVTVIAIPVWVRVANRIGKHKAYGLAMFLSSLAINAFWFINPDHHSQATVAVLGACVLFFVSFSTACGFVAPAAMLADVVDYGTWRTGEARAGSYFAFHSLILKIAVALGSGLGFILLGLFSYSVKEGVENSPMSKVGLLVTVLLIPGILKAIGGLIIWHFPLDRRRHDILRRRLESRRMRQPPPRPLEAGEPGWQPAV